MCLCCPKPAASSHFPVHSRTLHLTLPGWSLSCVICILLSPTAGVCVGGLSVSVLRSDSVLGRLHLPADTIPPSSLPEPAGKPGKSSQCLWCLGRECRVKCPEAPCAHPASGSGAGAELGPKVPLLGLPCPLLAAIPSSPAPLLGPEREVAVPAGSGGFCHGESPQLLLRTPQLGLLPTAIEGL